MKIILKNRSGRRVATLRVPFKQPLAVTIDGRRFEAYGLDVGFRGKEQWTFAEVVGIGPALDVAGAIQDLEQRDQFAPVVVANIRTVIAEVRRLNLHIEALDEALAVSGRERSEALAALGKARNEGMTDARRAAFQEIRDALDRIEVGF